MYWVLANLPPKYRSSLHAIQLAVLCKVNTVKERGYDEVLCPLIEDLVSLEENGVYVEKLGASIKGSVLCCSRQFGCSWIGRISGELYCAENVQILHGHTRRNPNQKCQLRFFHPENQRCS